MTLIIGLKSKDGLVITSDSKASAEITSNDTVQKVFKLSDHDAVGIAGDGGLAMYFLDQIKEGLNYNTGISDLAEQIRVKGKEKFNDFFEHLVPEKRPSLSLLLAGYTKEHSPKPEIYSLNSKDNFVPRKAVTGFECVGVPYIADYLLNRLYDKEIKVEAAEELGVFCIQETGSQSSGVGGPTRVYTFSATKSFQELSAEEVAKLTDKTKQFQVTQKSKFYPEDPNSGSANPNPL
jgi:20S proteasome alpha/beta subunit